MNMMKQGDRRGVAGCLGVSNQEPLLACWVEESVPGKVILRLGAE